MSSIINFITNLLGILLIPYGAYLIYALEKFTAWDFVLVCFASFMLIWFKDDSARKIVEKILSSRFGDNLQQNNRQGINSRRVRSRDNTDNFINDRPE